MASVNGISRRSVLLGAAAAFGCGHRKARAFFGFCFVANQESRSITVVDLTRFRVRKHIPLDAAPSAIIAAPSQPKVYVLTPETGTVYEIEAGALAVTRRAHVGRQAAAMQCSPANDALWVLSRDPAQLVELPFDKFKPARRIALPAPGDAFDLSREKQAAVAICENRSIVLASLANSKIERVISAESDPSLVRFERDGARVLVGSTPERLLTIFDVATGQTIVRLPLPLEPREFCFNSDGGQLFVSGDGMDAVVIVYPYRTEVAETMLAGRAPGGMAIATVTQSQSEYLMVANPETDTITVLDFGNSGKKLVAVVKVGQRPRRIVITPDNQYALVLNEQSGDLAVIRVVALAVSPDGKPRRYQTAPLFTMVPTGAKPVDAAVVQLG
jgi:DNA-binding beta-propeller fold protein YncE